MLGRKSRQSEKFNLFHIKIHVDVRRCSMNILSISTRDLMFYVSALMEHQTQLLLITFKNHSKALGDEWLSKHFPHRLMNIHVHADSVMPARAIRKLNSIRFKRRTKLESGEIRRKKWFVSSNPHYAPLAGFFLSRIHTNSIHLFEC
jgi:hypothetical protein